MAVTQEQIEDYLPIHELTRIQQDRESLADDDLLLVSQYDDTICGNYVSRCADIGTLKFKISTDLNLEETIKNAAAVEGISGALAAADEAIIQQVQGCSALLNGRIDGCFTAVDTASADTKTQVLNNVQNNYIAKYGKQIYLDIPSGYYITKLRQNENAQIIGYEGQSMNNLLIEKDRLAPGLLSGQVLTSRIDDFDEETDEFSYTMQNNAMLFVNTTLQEDDDHCGPVEIMVNGILISRTGDDGAVPRSRCFSQQFPIAKGQTVSFKYQSNAKFKAGCEFQTIEMQLNPAEFVGLDKVYQPLMQEREEHAKDLYRVAYDKYGTAYDVEAVSGKQLDFGIWKFKTDKNGIVVDAQTAPVAGAGANGLMLSSDKAKLDKYPSNGYSAGTDISLSSGVIGHKTLIQKGGAGTSANTSGIKFQVPYIGYSATGHVISAGVHTHTIPDVTTNSNGLMLSSDKSLIDSIDSKISGIVEGYVKKICLSAHPIGSLYIAIDSSSKPNTLFGGSWTLLSGGYCLVTSNPSATNPDFGNLNVQLGSIVEGILPAHKHMLEYLAAPTGNYNATTTTDNFSCPAITRNKNPSTYSQSDNTYTSTSFPLKSTNKTGSYGEIYSGASTYVRPTGIAVYIWKRTA